MGGRQPETATGPPGESRVPDSIVLARAFQSMVDTLKHESTLAERSLGVPWLGGGLEALGTEVRRGAGSDGKC